MKIFSIKNYEIILNYDDEDELKITVIFKNNDYVNYIHYEDDYFTLSELYENMNSESVSINGNIMIVTLNCQIGITTAVKTAKFQFMI